MAGKVTLDLTDPIIGHGGPVKKVVLRQPLARDFFELGEPFAHARNKDGTLFSAENTEAIKAYIERLVEEPDALLLQQMSLADAIKVKEAVLGFFMDARAASLLTTAGS